VDASAPSDAVAPPGGKRFPCARCGAKLEFAPRTSALKCPYCGHENPIPESGAAVEELDFLAHLEAFAAAEPTHERETLKCDACGAEIHKPPQIEALSCPYCGSNIVAMAASRRLIKPRALLPFKIERDEAQARFRHWLGKLWFAPDAVKQYARVEQRLTGLYVPYWTYDCHTTSAYTGERGEHYYVTVGSGKNRRTQRRTRWYPASGVVRNRFNDVLVLASRSLPRRCAERLEPWDLRSLAPYDDAYLSGFTAEGYQIDLAGGFEVARGIMDETIEATVRADIGGDEQRIHSVDTRYADITFKHVLLPVWISAYRYKQRVYRFLVNARTGEVQGERPYSWVKIALVVLAGLSAAAAAWWLAQQYGAW